MVTGSTFSDNKATNDDGGAIDSGDYQATGTLTVTTSTFSSNTANYDGGAIDSGDDSGNGTLSCQRHHVLCLIRLTGAAPSTTGTRPGPAPLASAAPTFTGNSVSTDGGAIDNGDGGGTGTLTISWVDSFGELRQRRRRGHRQRRQRRHGHSHG